MECQVCGSFIATETQSTTFRELLKSRLRFPNLLFFCKTEQEKRSKPGHCVSFYSHFRQERIVIHLILKEHLSFEQNTGGAIRECRSVFAAGSQHYREKTHQLRNIFSW